MAAAVNLPVSPAAASTGATFGVDARGATAVSANAGADAPPASAKSSVDASEFSVAVHSINRPGNLEAPLPIRRLAESPATTSSSFGGGGGGGYSGGGTGTRRRRELWLDGDGGNDDGRPGYASEGTGFSTLTAGSRGVGDGGSAAASSSPGLEDSDSTLSADDSEPESAAAAAAAGWGVDVRGVGVGGVVSGPSVGVIDRHMLIETDRTSVSSSDDWADCEYEMVAAQRVNDLFEQIDGLLFRTAATAAASAVPEPSAAAASSSATAHTQQQQQLPAKTHEECAEWRAAFPHLRLRGVQLAPPSSGGRDSGQASPRSHGIRRYPAPPAAADDSDATPRAPDQDGVGG